MGSHRLHVNGFQLRNTSLLLGVVSRAHAQPAQPPRGLALQVDTKLVDPVLQPPGVERADTAALGATMLNMAWWTWACGSPDIGTSAR